MKFTFSVRKKSLKDFPLMEGLEKIFGGLTVIPFPAEYGIVTAANSRHFPGLQLMLYSLRKWHSVPVLIYDVGMTANQLQWLESVPDVLVAPQFNPPCGHMVYWQAWAKPFYVQNSAFKKIMWIDCDTVITGNLMEIVDAAADQPFFTADHTGINEGTYNDPALYMLMPLDGVTKDFGKYLNTGVFILDRDRDVELIREWCNFVQEAVENHQIELTTKCWDQGACKWVLQKLNLLHTINSKIEFNYPAKSRQCPFPPTPRAMEVFVNTISDGMSNNVVVFHFMGNPKPWFRWSEMLPIQIVPPTSPAIIDLGGTNRGQVEVAHEEVEETG
jgi:hypothetical protein